MKKSLFIILLTFLTLFISSCSKEAQNPQNQLQIVENDLKNVINTYKKASLLTQKVLKTNPNQKEYNIWVNELKETLETWKKLENESNILSENSQKLINDFDNKEETSIFLDIFTLDPTYSVTKKEITSVFDNAQSGQKLKTLAKFLNTDAKRAFEVLKMTNEQIKAQAWTQQGDTMEKLENSARIIKDSCKVGLHIGGTILTGGATTGSVSLLQKGAVIVQNTDLLLEIGQDSASIALGYNDDITVLLKNAKDITGTASAIIGYKGLFSAADTFGNVKTFSFAGEQLNSLIQENKIANIEIDWENEKTQANKMTPKETNDWLNKNSISSKPKIDKNNTNEVKEDTNDKENKDKSKEKTSEEEKNISDENIIGTWSEVKRSKEYDNYLKTNFEDSYDELFFKFRFDNNKDFYIYSDEYGWQLGGNYTPKSDKWMVQYEWSEKTDAIITINGNQLKFQYTKEPTHILYMEK